MRPRGRRHFGRLPDVAVSSITYLMLVFPHPTLEPLSCIAEYFFLIFFSKN